MPRKRAIDRFRAALLDSDDQVRLNAAVRLAYMGRADGLDELVGGLSHPEDAIRLVQVPEALSLLGEAGVAPARTLVHRRGPSRLAAARVLMHAGELDGVVGAINSTLAASDLVEVAEAASLAGELGAAADQCFSALVAVWHRHGPNLHIALPALAAVGGLRAIPYLSRGLRADEESTRIGAMRGLMGLGPVGSDSTDRLVAVLHDSTLSLRERMTAAQALTRVGLSGESVAADLQTAMNTADRWLRIALLRALSQLAPRYPRRAEVSAEWPLWESRFVHSALPRQLVAVGPVLDSAVEHLNHDDHDVRRNAALAIALYGGDARSVLSAVARAPRLAEPLREEVLRRLARRPRREPPAADWPWDLHMTVPPVDLDAIAEDCERQWAHARSDELEYRIGVPKWQFLEYMVKRRGLLLHGSRTPNLSLLQPRSRSWGGGRTAGQPGVFAVDHALMAMYFAVLDSKRGFNTPNGLYQVRRPDGFQERGFHLAANFVALSTRPFINATVYILSPESFSMMGELTSLTAVRPVARLAVTPTDFPLLEYLWGSDGGPLSTQFGDSYRHLRDVGMWPSKRSVLSARL